MLKKSIIGGNMTNDTAEKERKEGKKYGKMLDAQGNVIGETEISIEVGKTKGG
jgi:hypothetical protein